MYLYKLFNVGYSWMDGLVIVALAQEGGVGGTGTEEQSHLISQVTESLLAPYVILSKEIL